MTRPKPSTTAIVDLPKSHPPTSGVGLISRIALGAADAVAFSSALAAAVGAALTLVASRTLGAPDEGRWIGLVAAGTFIIYNLDRLRDFERDRETSPSRTAFVLQYQKWLYAGVFVAGSSFAAILRGTPPRMILLCLLIGLVGLFHRRIKERPALKTLYVSIAWVGACLGLPWIASEFHPLGSWVAGIFLASLAANLMASNLRDNEVMAIMRGEGGHDKVLWTARGFLLLAMGGAVLGPDPMLALIWIPLSEGLALIRFRPTERYGHLAVDGGLLLGALASTLHLATLGIGS